MCPVVLERSLCDCRWRFRDMGVWHLWRGYQADHPHGRGARGGVIVKYPVPATGIIAVYLGVCGAVLLVDEDGLSDYHCIVEDSGVGVGTGV